MINRRLPLGFIATIAILARAPLAYGGQVTVIHPIAIDESAGPGLARFGTEANGINSLPLETTATLPTNPPFSDFDDVIFVFDADVNLDGAPDPTFVRGHFNNYFANFGRFVGGEFIGEISSYKATRNYERLADGSVFIRFSTLSDSSLQGFPNIFDYSIGLARPDATREIIPSSLTTAGLATLYDIPIGTVGGAGGARIPQIRAGDVLGHVDMDGFMTVPRGTAARLGLYVTAAVAVRDPLVKTASQQSQLGQSQMYAPKRYDEYVEKIKDQKLALEAVPNRTPLEEATLTRLTNEIQYLDAAATRASYSFNNKGCVVTSYAMALSAIEIPTTSTKLHTDLNDGDYLTPIKALQNLQGVPKFEGADCNPASIRALYSDVSIRPAPTHDAIVKALANGDTVVARVNGGGHSVLLYGVSADAAGQPQFDVFDPSPGRSQDYTASRAQGNARSLLSMNWTPNNSWIVSRDGPSTATVTLNSPVEVTLVDPLGNEVQFGTQRGIISSDFADVSLSYSYPILDPDSSYTAEELLDLRMNGDLPTILALPNGRIQPGQYTVRVNGVGDGDFSILFDTGQSAPPIRFAGNITQGQSLEYTTIVGVAITAPGDFDADGTVDGSDFLEWQRDPSIGNLAEWRDNFGTAAGQFTGTSVPEPTTMLQATIAGCILCAGQISISRRTLTL